MRGRKKRKLNCTAEEHSRRVVESIALHQGRFRVSFCQKIRLPWIPSIQDE